METPAPTETTGEPGTAPGLLRYVEELANTIDVEVGSDELASPRDAARWIAARPDLTAGAGRVSLTPGDFERLLALRTALREALAANHDGEAGPEAFAHFNQMAAGVPLHVGVGPGPSARLEATGTSVDVAIGRLLGAVYDAIAAGTWQRLKICPADTCRWAFYDRSRNRSGTWCSMRVCGNRAKVRRYQQKLRGKGQDGA